MDLLAGGVWIAAGLIAGRRMGALMLATGAAWLLTLLTGIPLYLAVAAHLLLAFPGGRLASRTERALVAAAYTLVLLPPPVTLPGGAALTTVLVFVLARRYRAASVPRRRVLAPVLASGGALGVLTAAMMLAGAAGRQELKYALMPAVLAAFAAVPCAFVAGGVRDRLRRAGAYRVLAARLEHPVDLRLALSEALGDPSLQLAYAAPRGYISDQGVPVELPGPREWTAIARAGKPIAALVHDAALAEDAAHVRAVGATAALALENEQLAAELRARIAELRESRARVVEAAEEERRRIERDLHDGAQQRLAGLALELGLALDRLDRGGPALRERADGALARQDAADAPVAALRESLLAARRQADNALAELRALAHGIHPPLLTEQGLPAAIRTLLRDAPIDTVYDGPDALELAPAVESTLYFVVAEALANVLKHAGASRVTVRLAGTTVAVADDGAGGATLGRGLQGLADRVRALDGELELDSPPGAGTTLRARCAP